MIETLAAKVIEGARSQGWKVIGRGGTWAGAMRPLEQYIQRKVKRAVRAERNALLLECIDIVALHGGSVEIEAAIRAKMEQPE